LIDTARLSIAVTLIIFASAFDRYFAALSQIVYTVPLIARAQNISLELA